mgnify:CR=1 FL=1
MELIKIKQTIKYVLKKRNYFILFLCASILSFFIFYLLTLATTTDQSLSIFIMMNGLLYTLSTFFIFAVIAILFGIYASLFAYKIRINCKGKNFKNSILGSSGFITGILGSGCPMCGSAVFAIIGMPLALFFLPLKGLELRLLSLILVILSTYFLVKSLSKCELPTSYS